MLKPSFFHQKSLYRREYMPIRVIQIGVGGFGTSWRHTLTTNSDVEVVALIDINRDELKEAAQFFNIPEDRCFLNPDDNWTDMDAELVIDSTPQLYHHSNAMKVFSDEKDLIVVKPMSDQWETGVAMVEEAERMGRKMVVAQQLRFHPVIMKIREIIQSGKLGQVGYIYQDAFFGKKGYSGSYPQPYPLLVQGAIHFFDYIRWVLNQDALAVWADCWNPSWTEGAGMRCAHVAFEMNGGCRVCFRGVATDSDHTNWTCNWRLEGENGILKVINDHIFLNDKEIPVSWEDDTDISDLNLPVLNNIVFEKFVSYLEGGEEPGFSGRNNLKSLEMVFGAIKSHETGQRYRMSK
jgi:predicted dehydrogenase